MFCLSRIWWQTQHSSTRYDATLFFQSSSNKLCPLGKYEGISTPQVTKQNPITRLCVTSWWLCIGTSTQDCITYTAITDLSHCQLRLSVFFHSVVAGDDRGGNLVSLSNPSTFFRACLQIVNVTPPGIESGHEGVTPAEFALPSLSEWVDGPTVLCSLFLWFGLILSTQNARWQPLMMDWRRPCFPGSCPGMFPHLLLFQKLSWCVLKKPAEETLAWFLLGQTPKHDTKSQCSLLWNPSSLPHLFSSSSQSPNLINHVGRGKRGRGRSMWCNLHPGKVTRQHHSACSSRWFYSGKFWIVLRSSEAWRSTTSVWDPAGDILTFSCREKSWAQCLLNDTRSLSFLFCCLPRPPRVRGAYNWEQPWTKGG